MPARWPSGGRRKRRAGTRAHEPTGCGGRCPRHRRPRHRWSRHPVLATPVPGTPPTTSWTRRWPWPTGGPPAGRPHAAPFRRRLRRRPVASPRPARRNPRSGTRCRPRRLHGGSHGVRPPGRTACRGHEHGASPARGAPAATPDPAARRGARTRPGRAADGAHRPALLRHLRDGRLGGRGPRPVAHPGTSVLAGQRPAHPLPDGDAIRHRHRGRAAPRHDGGAAQRARPDHRRRTAARRRAGGPGPGQDVPPRGQECRGGDELLASGALVTPAVLGLAAAAGTTS